ncbi:MAG: hypothetical protein JXB30_12335 [Anaerolineae bacterium]|nr:hypothetical protein [Anaerolineae bacterium]
MIPEFTSNGNLPPGVHWATWQEFVERFGVSPYRQELIQGLKVAVDSLKAAGCKTVYVNGSFVTSKEVPGDFDACWDPEGVDIDLLYAIEPVLFSFEDRRAAQKEKFKGELFPASEMASADAIFLDFFQIDREGHRKGIIALDLGEL